MRWQSWTTLATAGAVAWAAVTIVANPAASLFSNLRPSSGVERWGPDYFPNVPLITQDGATVHFYDDLLKGKAVAINLMYTTCQDECPLETARLVQLQRLLGDRVGRDLFLYSITIDPRRDTPEVLKEYAAKFHVGPGWLFLTGDVDDIKLISKKMGLSSTMDIRSSDPHATMLMVGDEPAHQWMQNSAEDNPQFLASTIGTFLGWRNETRAPSYAEARPLALDWGGYVFRTRCVGCHTIGGGDMVGPDLAGVSTLRESAWLARYLAEPDQVLAEGDPIAAALFARYNRIPMPNLALNSEDVAALLAYLDAQSFGSAGPPG
jgi:protein SCO1